MSGVPPRFPMATLATAVIVAMMVAAQLSIPPLLPLLGRDPSMLQSGELWRSLTALFVQDYGLAGALINLATLLILGPVAEKRLGTAQWLVVYFGGGVVTEFLALAWQPHGAGNSIACFALAGALTLRALKRTMGVIQLCVCIVSVSAAVTLLLLRDIHGLGYWAGVACAFAWCKLHELRPRPGRGNSPVARSGQ